MTATNRGAALRKQLVALSRYCHRRGWSLATSSNYSCRLDARRFLITASGRAKESLTTRDVLEVSVNGKILRNQKKHPSAETILHATLYRLDPRIGAVLHTHSAFATILSLKTSARLLRLQGYEMLKALSGVTTHLHTEQIPIFANTQNLQRLSVQLSRVLRKRQNIHAFLISAHGLYTWGKDLSEAKRHMEALEFLLECEFLRKILGSSSST